MHGNRTSRCETDNILISGQHALVTDFGIAKAISASASNATLTSSGLAIGTPSYMAPEQVAATSRPTISGPLRHRLSGANCWMDRPPFTGTSAQAVIAAQLTQVLDPVSRHRPGIPPRLPIW
jgi:serine/threonine-protein kinase